MKIVCDACQAKYSISDDKVQGKVFKIRCKKCSNIIVVRGGAAAAEPAAPPAQEKEHRVYDYGYEAGDQAPAGDDAVWHVVINQDQVGPMTAGDVQKRFSSGEIDAETYIWREGFGDWMPLAQVDTFAAMAASGSTTAALQPRSSGSGSGAEAIGAMFAAGATGEEAGTVRSDPGDLFASAAAGAARGDDDGGDLFGSKPAAHSPQAAQAAQAKLRGERNENSVLFSLNNLAQLASNRPAPAPQAQAAAAPGGPAPAGHATGGSGGEGSGLIDIRSMASAYLGAQPGAARAQGTSSAIGSIDDLPVFGGGGFSEPAVIVPTARAANNNKLLYALIGSVGLLAVAAVVLVIVMVKGGGKSESKSSESDKIATSVNPDKPDDKDDKTTTPSTTGSGSDTTKPAEAGSGSSAAATPPPSETKTDTAAKPADPKKDKPKPSSSTSSKPSSSSSGAAVVSSRTTPKPPTTTPTTTPPPPTSGGDSGSCDEVSCVLNNYEGACCAKFKKGGSRPSGGTAPSGGAKPAGGGDLPASLDRSMISEGVAKVKAAVQRCGDKSSAKGTVKVGVKVTPDGSVASVTVKETPDGALGGCVQSAMSRATFKKTQNGGSFSFPFVF